MMYGQTNLSPLYGPSSPPFQFAGDIQQGMLPPDLDAAYRGAFWAARSADTILDHCRPSGVSYHMRALIRSNGKGRIIDFPFPSSASYAEAPVPLIFLLDEWLRAIGYAVRPVADEIALARGKRKPIRFGKRTAATHHELALEHAEFVGATLYRALRKAARLSSINIGIPPYRELFEKHWQNIAPALADTPQLGMEFRSALKLEALRTVEYRRKHSAPAAVSQAETPPLDMAKAAANNHEPTHEKPKRAPGKGRPQAETNRIVKDYLDKHPEAKIPEIVKATRCAQGSVQKSPAWRKVNHERKASRTGTKSNPLSHQLRNEGEASILAVHCSPLDEAIRKEEEGNKLAWGSILEIADPPQRGVLNRMKETERLELIKYAGEYGREKTKALIQTIVERKREGEIEEEQCKQRSSRRSRSRS